MSSILDLPHLTATIEVGNNEDWLDTFAFAGGGTVVAVAAAGNTGNGSVEAAQAALAAPIGNTIVAIANIAANEPGFVVTDPNGTIVGAGLVGAPYAAGGLQFTLAQGSTPFVVGDAFTVTVFPKPIDLTGIGFDFALKTDPLGLKAALRGSTASGTLISGLAAGTLAFAVPRSAMGGLAPRSYAFDVRAMADGITRRCIVGTVAIVAGIAGRTAP